MLIPPLLPLQVPWQRKEGISSRRSPVPMQCIAPGPWRRMRCMVMAAAVPDAGAGARKCVSASVSRCKKVWNLNGGGTHAVCAAALHDHAQEHGSVYFHPVLPLFATGGRGGALTLWHLNWDYNSIRRSANSCALLEIADMRVPVSDFSPLIAASIGLGYIIQSGAGLRT